MNMGQKMRDVKIGLCWTHGSPFLRHIRKDIQIYGGEHSDMEGLMVGKIVKNVWTRI